MPFQIFSLRKIQTWEQFIDIRMIMTRYMLIELYRAYVHPSFGNLDPRLSISKRNSITKCRTICNHTRFINSNKVLILSQQIT
ncbi:hypothetical protein Hanom_Chr16g01496001 [Helianthus anomalus]